MRRKYVPGSNANVFISTTRPLSFNGNDVSLLVSDHPSLDRRECSTVTAWIYLEEYPQWAGIVTKGNKTNINKDAKKVYTGCAPEEKSVAAAKQRS
jgi:hypothetical protein